MIEGEIDYGDLAPDDPRHGQIISAYTYHHCRCPKCRALSLRQQKARQPRQPIERIIPLDFQVWCKDVTLLRDRIAALEYIGQQMPDVDTSDDMQRAQLELTAVIRNQWTAYKSNEQKGT